MAHPSPLDSPRFFDDPALSAWSQGDELLAASKEDFKDLKAVAHGVSQSTASDPNKVDEIPIPIELVRGANGVEDDTWTVLIDGMRCQLRRPEGVAQGPFKCMLPPGVARKALTAESKVRSLAIAVRLENEAIAPVSCTAALYQVLRTDERQVQDTLDAPPVEIGQRIPLTPYRVGSISVDAITLPYPYWAPAQSTLGILSFRPVQRWLEKQDSVRASNLYTTAVNAAGAAAYSARFNAYIRLKEEEAVYNSTSEVLKQLAILGNDPTAAKKLSGTNLRNYLDNNVTEPKAPKQSRFRYVPSRPGANSSESFLIGGGRHSAARELTELFVALSNVCQQQKATINTEGGRRSIREQLVDMRLALDLSNDITAKALFDALLSTDPYPATKTLLDMRINKELLKSTTPLVAGLRREDIEFLTGGFRRFYIINECANGDARPDLGQNLGQYTVQRNTQKRVGTLTDEARTALNDANKKALEEEALRIQGYTADYAFCYDRLTLESRKRTTLRLGIKVEIVDFDGSSFEVEFEADETDGVVAHAVYSNFAQDLDDLDVAAQEFVRCIFDVHAAPILEDDDALAKDVATDIANSYLVKLVFGKYQKRSKDMDLPQFKSILEIFKYMTYDTAEAVVRRLSLGAPFKLDPCRLEERVAELRLMMREILPIWPPPPPPPVVPSIEQTDEDIQRYYQRKADPVPEALVELDGNGLAQEYFNEQRRQEEQANLKANEPTSLEAQRQIEIKRQNEEERELRRMRTDTPDAFSVVYTQQALIKRTMPQLVIFGSPISIPIQLPISPAPGPIYLPSKGEKERILWKSLGFAWDVGLKYLLPAAVVGVSTLGFFATVTILTNNEIDRQKLSGVYNLVSSVAEVIGRQAGIIFDGTGQLNQASIELLSSLFSVAWTDLTADQRRQVMLTQAYQSVLPIAANLATLTLQFQDRRFTGKTQGALQLKAYEDHLYQLRGVPVESAVAAAREAFARHIQATRELQHSHGLNDSAVAVYNNRMDQRFNFYEFFLGEDGLNARKPPLLPINRNEQWAAVPDANALRLLPPFDIADRLFEAEELRGMPLSDTTDFVAGRAPLLAGTSPAIVAAKAAFHELFQVVLRHRRLLRGEHLMQTSAQTALEIAKRASNVLVTVYGIRAGVTLVGGDDVLWTCVKGGAAARLCVRHLPLFQRAEALRAASDPQQRLETMLKFWRRPRRAIMEAFAKALVVEAQAYQQASTESQFLLPPFKELSIEAARTFSRVRSLARDPLAVAVVASSISHSLLAASPPGDKVSAHIMEFIVEANVLAERFFDQVDADPPAFKPQSIDEVSAAWASRRMLLDESRNLKVSVGADTVVGLLSHMQLSSNTTTATTATTATTTTTTRPNFYYCPMGSRLSALPTRVPFDVDVLSSRVVWLSEIEQAASWLMNAIQPPSSTASSGVSIYAILNGRQTGLERHPLTLVQQGGSIRVPVAAISPRPESSTDVQYALTLPAAVQQLKGMVQSPDSIQNRIQSLRAVAYNAERLLFSLMLATANLGSSRMVSVHLPAIEDVVSLAIAMSLQKTDTGATLSELAVYLPEGAQPAAKQRLEDIVEQVRFALEKGCKVCSLSEVALCL